ncbi:hypothetical protein [Mesorhizobium sp. M0618]|uniref:hypothetical protein n=1 Tax=unclassified Mesorhizobium TaxID=325217 RepID=UPI003337B5D8
MNLYSGTASVEVRIFTDFESMAQYEEIFLHTALQNDKYLDVAESAVDMILDEPQDEMYVRLDADDFFMNRKGDGQIETGSLDLSRTAPLNKKVATFRTEREYCASKGRLRDVMQLNFQFAQDLKVLTGHGSDYFCTRFSALRIGSSKLYFDSEDCPQCADAFLEQDLDIATRFPGLLLSPPMTKVYKRITSDTLSFNMRGGAHAAPAH